jgi:sialate O-acetylesterase
MRALISGWRNAFENANLPFYFVQLPGSGAGPGWPYLREQQRLSSDLPNTGMVVTIDLLDEDIHPPNKVDVGERLARWALAGAYQKQTPFSGPLFEGAEFGGGEATVYFSHAENGLMVATKRELAEAEETPQTKLANFELADQEGRWQPASAVIKGRTVKVTSERVPSPVAVRYAYAVNPQGCNLYNRDGLPASPFCSNPALLDYAPEIASD